MHASTILASLAVAALSLAFGALIAVSILAIS